MNPSLSNTISALAVLLVAAAADDAGAGFRGALRRGEGVAPAPQDRGLVLEDPTGDVAEGPSARPGRGADAGAAPLKRRSRRNLLSLMRRKRRNKNRERARAQAAAEYADPKSVAPRVDAAAGTVPTPVLTGGGAARIEGPAPGEPLPFRTAPFNPNPKEQCVPRRDIENLSGALRHLINSGIRAFPRNGFLLGIVRHGGYLPHEHFDADLGIVYEDLDRLPREPVRAPATVEAAGFSFHLKPTSVQYINWQGRDPATGEPYDWFAAELHGDAVDALKLSFGAVYEYRGTGRYFYPWCTQRVNHKASLPDAFRYGREGGDFRLVDTDEMLDESNYRPGVQLGSVFDTDLTCFVEKQFYFTTIPVPCDYEKILTALYGTNWHRVASRGEVDYRSWKTIKFETLPVSEEDNEKILAGGPRPMCEE